MADMLKDLLKPDFLPDKTNSVSLVQTHISLVFVADQYVYKIKKAVNFGFLDFSTLEKRQYYCTQEVKLNQRLSEDLYLGVIPVRFDGKHHRMGGGEGDIVEYAVKMRRIPDNKLMKALFEKGELHKENLKAIVEVLSEFHQSADRSNKIDRFGDPETFKVNTDENFEQTEKYIDTTIQREDFKALQQWTEQFYRDNKGFFYDRIGAGKIRDCHGDLHMEHICLTEPIAIFDCIEFNERFRYSDTIADFAFLLMDLEYRGGKDYAKTLWSIYREIAGEKNVETLLSFYKVYRAYVRGKVISFQLDDSNIDLDAKEKAEITAQKYFKLARSYIDT